MSRTKDHYRKRPEVGGEEFLVFGECNAAPNHAHVSRIGDFIRRCRITVGNWDVVIQTVGLLQLTYFSLW